MKQIALLTFIALLMISCSKEKITPAFGVETLDEQLEGRAIELTYDVDDINVDAFGGELRDVGGDVGTILQRLAASFADIELREGNVGYVDLETQTYEFPELDDIDFEVITGVALTGVHVQLVEGPIPADASADTNADANAEDSTVTDESEETLDLSFVKSLEIFLIVDNLPTAVPNVMPVYDEDETPNPIYQGKKSTLLFSYKKSDDANKFEDDCEKKCFSLVIENGQVRDILKNNRTFSVDIRLKVDAVPRSNLRLKSKFDFALRINPGF
ncbi:hypothetical protein A9Q84_09940 [Halobacteriovorax marinus]|uniref:Lipoprotein n=1 Tax=Halobacteriovorax marinus TaxID=97084 RepID=A0A1Y5F7F0_9BACT|nr:hypothetical protein A9Q84_09940 [Halobacteriovorax marinus]